MDDHNKEIEEKIAYLERYAEQLDAVLREAFERIERLEREVTGLRAETSRRFDALAESDPTDEKPPHWGSG